MIILPVRMISNSQSGVMCRLGSEPAGDAAVEFIPKDCVVRISETQESDLAVVVIDPQKAPEWLIRAMGR